MKKIEDICIIVQARLGSQRVPKKMIRPIGNSCLLDICLNKIKECKSFPKENFYLSVYEDELVNIGKSHNLNIFNRSKKSAMSEGTPMTDMYEWWNKLPFKYCVLINACAPFLEPETIDNFIEHYKNTISAGLFAVVKKKNYFWDKGGKILTPLTEAVMNTKTVGETYEAAHCLYAGKMDKIGEGEWMGDFRNPKSIELWEMPELESFDVDYEWQFSFANKIIQGK